MPSFRSPREPLAPAPGANMLVRSSTMSGPSVGSSSAFEATMRRFVPKQLLFNFAPNPPDPRTRQPAVDEVDGAVAFFDVSGFSKLSNELLGRSREASLASQRKRTTRFSHSSASFSARAAGQGAAMASEDLQGFLSGALEGLVDLVLLRGGDIIKFAGDAVIVLWSSTRLKESLAVCACRAAECARMALDQREVTEASSLGLHIGVAAGRVALVHVGGVLGRWENTLVGEPVMRMFDAEDEASDGDVVLHESAGALVRDEPGATARLEPCDAPGFFRLVTLEYALPDSPGISAASPRVPAEIMKQYMPGPLLSLSSSEGQGTLRTATVLFIRLVDLTREHLETFSFAKLTRSLHTRLQRVQETVYRFYATMRQFIVDDKGVVVIAALGLPPWFHEDNAARAVKIGLSLAERFPVSVGITTGDAFCGIVGSTQRAEYCIVGDSVNFAARLMCKAAPNEVVVDTATRRAAGQITGASTQSDYVKVKGKDDFEHVFRLRPLGRDAGAMSNVLEVFNDHAGIVGRAEQIEELRMACRPLQLDQPAPVVVIEGERGAGKSLLLAQIGQFTAPTHIHLLGFGDAVEQRSTKYYAWRNVIAVLLELRLDFASATPDSRTSSHDRTGSHDRIGSGSLEPPSPTVVGVTSPESRSSTEELRPAGRFSKERVAGGLRSMLNKLTRGDSVRSLRAAAPSDREGSGNLQLWSPNSEVRTSPVLAARTMAGSAEPALPTDEPESREGSWKHSGVSNGPNSPPSPSVRRSKTFTVSWTMRPNAPVEISPRAIVERSRTGSDAGAETSSVGPSGVEPSGGGGATGGGGSSGSGGGGGDTPVDAHVAAAMAAAQAAASADQGLSSGAEDGDAAKPAAVAPSSSRAPLQSRFFRSRRTMAATNSALVAHCLRKGRLQLQDVATLNAILPMRLGVGGARRAPSTKDIANVLVVMLGELCQVASASLVFDDAHLLDSSSWKLLAAVMASLPHLPVFVAVTPSSPVLEPEYGGFLMLARERLEQMRIGPLSRFEVMQILIERLSVTSVDPQVVDFLFERSRGKPGAVIELVHSLLSAQMLVREDGVLTARGELSDMDVQVTEQERADVIRRHDSLPPAARYLLKVLAVAGDAVPLALLRRLIVEAQRVLPAPDAESAATALAPDQLLGDPLQDLLAADLVDLTPDETAVIFPAEYVRYVIYRLMLHAHRKRLHRVVVQWYTGHHSEEALRPLLEDLGYHCVCSQQWGRALEFFTEAAAGHRAAGNTQGALELLQICTDLIEEQQLGDAVPIARVRVMRAQCAIAGRDYDLADKELALALAALPRRQRRQRRRGGRRRFPFPSWLCCGPGAGRRRRVASEAAAIAQYAWDLRHRTQELARHTRRLEAGVRAISDKDPLPSTQFSQVGSPKPVDAELGRGLPAAFGGMDEFLSEVEDRVLSEVEEVRSESSPPPVS